MEAKRLIIKGRVQGVWYRGWTVDQAVKLGVKGWVRNLKTGGVEAFIMGDEITLNKMIGLCWKGPRLAKVKDIIIEKMEIEKCEGFSQRETI